MQRVHSLHLPTLFHFYRQIKIFITGFLIFLFVIPITAHAETSQWQARLTPNPVSFGTRNSITGIGSVSASLSNNTLTLQGEFKGLQGKATEIKLHNGPKAIPGPAVLDIQLMLEGDGKQGTIQAQLPLTEAQKQALINESLYIQINSEAAKEGNLRGWLLAAD